MRDLAMKIDEIAEIASQQWFKDCLDPTKRHIDQVQLVKANCKSAIYAGIEEALKMAPSEPIKVDQTEFGKHGNCQSACLAMLLNVPLESVPNFAKIAWELDDNAAAKAQDEWLAELGWGILTVVKWQSLPWPPKKGYYIAGGPSPRGIRHGVIYKDGELWHDPHDSRTGITEVQDIDILFPLAPHRAMRAVQWAEIEEGRNVQTL
jgi:hypothetical protein